MSGEDLLGRLEHQIDEFDPSGIEVRGHRRLVAESADWAYRSIEMLQSASEGNSGSLADSYDRAAFVLGLYRIRGAYGRVVDVEGRHLALQDFLKRFVTGDISSIQSWASSKRYYASIRN
jgi:hypothetical protein